MGNNCCINSEEQVLSSYRETSERYKLGLALQAIKEETETEMETPRQQRTAQDINEEAIEYKMEQEANRADAVTEFSKIIQAVKPFVDSDFPACTSSIYNKADDLTKEERQVYDKLIWRRASEIYEKPRLFVEGTKPNDIKQGYLGNCYLLATLSAMTEDLA